MAIQWQGVVGLNVFWPMGGPVANSGTYPADPYAISASGSWRSHVTSAIIARDLAAGIDHYRLQPSPAPFLQAMSANDTSRLNSYFAASDQWVDDCLTAGMKVMYSPFLSDPNIAPTQPLTGVGTAAHNAYKAWLVAVANRYKDRDPKMFALGLMNEPPHPSSFAGNWEAIQADWYAAVRAVAPNMTLGITSANYSSLYLLSGADFSGNVTLANSLSTTPYDDNVLYEFHPFLPSILCLQSATYTSNYKYVSGMSYPPVMADKAAVLASMTTAVNADNILSASAKTTMINDLTAEIGYFYSIPQDRVWLSQQFNNVETWRQAKGLTPAAIYVGEFGGVRGEARWPNGGNDDLSLARYNRDISIEIAKRFYRSAADHLDTPDYGLTTGMGTDIGSYRPAQTTALAWPRMKLTKFK